jgi:hypothetical protein
VVAVLDRAQEIVRHFEIHCFFRRVTASCVVRLLHFVRTPKVMVDFCCYNQYKYTRIGCGSLRRNKNMRYDTGRLELKLRLRERNRRNSSCAISQRVAIF